MLTAFDELLLNSNIEQFKIFRKNLITHGNFSNGSFAKYMDFDEDKNELDENASKNIAKLFVKRTMRNGNETKQDDGFVFTNDGTSKIIQCIKNESLLNLFQLKDSFLFNDNKKELWLTKKSTNKRDVISKNLQKFNKKTKVNYKTLGDKCQYLIIGKVTIIDKKDQFDYPLFLFPCIDIDEKKQTVEVANIGFFNFWLDTNKLDNQLAKSFGNRVIINTQFTSKLSSLQHNFEKFMPQNINLDTTFSSIFIVTGFSQEYLDPVWKHILSDRNSK